MKKCLFLALLMGAIVGCQKPIENHQPLDPTTWLPSDNVYVHYYGDSILPETGFPAMAFIIFQDTSYTYCYSYPPESSIRSCVYIMNYPSVTLYYDYPFGRTYQFGTFVDTLRLFINGDEYKYEDWSNCLVK